MGRRLLQPQQARGGGSRGAAVSGSALAAQRAVERVERIARLAEAAGEAARYDPRQRPMVFNPSRSRVRVALADRRRAETWRGASAFNDPSPQGERAG